MIHLTPLVRVYQVDPWADGSVRYPTAYSGAMAYSSFLYRRYAPHSDLVPILIMARTSGHPAQLGLSGEPAVSEIYTSSDGWEATHSLSSGSSYAYSSACSQVGGTG